MNWCAQRNLWSVEKKRKKIKNRFAWEKGIKRWKKRQGAGKKEEKGEHGESNNIGQQGTTYNNKKKHVITI